MGRPPSSSSRCKAQTTRVPKIAGALKETRFPLGGCVSEQWWTRERDAVGSLRVTTLSAGLSGRGCRDGHASRAEIGVSKATIEEGSREKAPHIIAGDRGCVAHA